MVYYFTRQEAIRLSGLPPGRLSYLDHTDVVNPEKLGSSKKPVCLYTWEQILELRAIYRLRQDVTLQELRKAIKYLQNCEARGTLYDKTLIAVNNIIYWIQNEPGEIEKLILQISGKSQGQAIILHTILPMCDLVADVRKLAKENAIEKFEERANMKSKIA